jgi:6-phosphogluconolactonase/glucosamine-6-phosphate isomerase/deaminase
VDVRLTDSADEAADHAGYWLARRLRDAVRRRGAATVAFSGGTTAPALLTATVEHGVPWEHVTVWQVDERVAPDGHPDRNANHLAVLPKDATVKLMPVTSKDLRRASARYAAGLPDRFDVVELGVGPDGHTASWPPGDPVIDSPRPVDLCEEYQGRVRMTLTPKVVNDARQRLVLVTGKSKAKVIAEWLHGETAAPIGRIRQLSTVVVLDKAAASQLPT